MTAPTSSTTRWPMITTIALHHYAGRNSVVSGIAGANGNCMQMRLIANDGTGKKVGCNPYPNTSGVYGASSASSSQLYGRCEARWMSTGTPGWKTAWLWWPQTWDWDFEIDWNETQLQGTMEANNHWPSSTHSASQADGFAAPVRTTAFHTSAMEWTPSSVKFILDGTVFGTSNRVPKAAGQSFLQTENNVPGDLQPTSDAKIYLDYYAQWLAA